MLVIMLFVIILCLFLALTLEGAKAMYDTTKPPFYALALFKHVWKGKKLPLKSANSSGNAVILQSYN